MISKSQEKRLDAQGVTNVGERKCYAAMQPLVDSYGLEDVLRGLEGCLMRLELDAKTPNGKERYFEMRQQLAAIQGRAALAAIIEG